MLKSNYFVWVKDILYCYNGKTWGKNKIPMKQYISGELYDFLKEIYITCYFDDASDAERKKYERILISLKNAQLKNEVVETTKETITNYKMEFDYNPDILGFDNIAFDLKSHLFRDYEHDDYVSATTGYDWVVPTEEQLNTIHNLLTSIFRDIDEKEAVLRIMSTGLEG